jgi:hypothetical protein
MRIHDWTLKLLLGLALVGVVTGCGKSDDKVQSKAPAPSPQASAPAPTAGTAATPPPTAPAPQSAMPVAASPASAAAIATADSDRPGIRVEVQELKRSADTLVLRFVLINDSNDQFHPYDKLGGLTFGYNTSGVYLVDGANKKKYLVVVDSQQKCVCSEGLDWLQSKSRMNLWARFPAPPGDVKKISVVVPHFTPMDDVPITGS